MGLNRSCRHANGHFEDEEAAKDMELARRIAIAPPSPPLAMVILWAPSSYVFAGFCLYGMIYALNVQLYVAVEFVLCVR